MNNAALKQQVEKIIDEGEGARRSVIDQMAPTPGQETEQDKERVLRLAAEVHRRRDLALSARELLPAPRQHLESLRTAAENAGSHSRALPASARRILDANATSLASQIGTALIRFAATEDVQNVTDSLRASGREYVQKLLEHDSVKKALGEKQEQKKKQAIRKKSQSEARSGPVSGSSQPVFWTSRSVAVELTKDDLARLPAEVPEIADVFLNRTLRLPRFIEPKSLPQSVMDEKASAWGIRRVGALSVWGAYGDDPEVRNARGKGIKVAVLDTGVDADHPDLKGKVKGWAEFDADGFEVPGSTPHDTDRHGTHCAGTIAGGRAGGSWIGMAPEADIYAGLVLTGGGGTDAQILAGIEWAIEQGVDVISMSLGGLTLDVEAPDPYSRAIVTALLAGIPVVTAIGNDGSQTTGTPGNDLFAFSVGATDHRDMPAGFSGGRTHLIRRSAFLASKDLPFIYSKPELTAPGVAVRSSVPGGQWAAFNGTSMATPHAAGAIALLLSSTRIRELVSDQQKALLIQDLLTGSVEEMGESGQDHRYGFGRLDILRAIASAHDLGYA